MIEKLLHSYNNGGYSVDIYNTGTKIRQCFDQTLSPELPEHMDLKITDWCDAACAWCHEKSTPQGKHANIQKTLDLLKDLRPGTEIAIGGGDPLSHPQFSEFVEALSHQGILPSVTVNGKHFQKHQKTLETLTSKNYLYGIGISYTGQDIQWNYPHAVLHCISGIHNPEKILSLSKRKLLILGYKNHGRGQSLYSKTSEKIQENISQWYRFLPVLAKHHSLSFDTLAIEQLNPKRLFLEKNHYDKYYMGEEGSFGLYIDAVTETYALSSYSPERFEWTTVKEMFKHTRSLRKI